MLIVGRLVAVAAALVTTLAPSTAYASAPDHGDPLGSLGCSAAYFANNPLLGPAHLADRGIVGAELKDYRRTGDLSVAEFLGRFQHRDAPGWIYPREHGFVVGENGRAFVWVQLLASGTLVDRYGSEHGSFLAPAGAAYARRALPPENLNGDPASSCNYSEYQVIRPFAVEAGAAAAWFGQAGGGVQYYLAPIDATHPAAPSTVKSLVDNQYLRRIAIGGNPVNAHEPLAATDLSFGQSVTVLVVIASVILLAGLIVIFARRDTPDASIVRSWLAISLVSALIILTTATLAIDDAQTRSTLIGGLTASAGAAVAFYFSSSSADKARQDILSATFGSAPVPDLVGKQLSEATKIVAATSLKLSVGSPAQYGDAMVVQSQKPSPQTVERNGTTITVVLAAAPPEGPSAHPSSPPSSAASGPGPAPAPTA